MKFLLCLLILASCASSKDVKGPGGEAQKLISCSQLGKCYEKAAEVCKGKFTSLDTKVNTITGYNGTTTEEVKLLIKCDSHD